jgi:hypothetical protein
MWAAETKSGEVRRDATRIAALTDALIKERRLLEELVRVLVAQRKGISSDDLEALDESVFAAHRVIRTLGEARQRRRVLLQLVGVDMDHPLRDLETMLGVNATADLCAARNELLDAASRLAGALSVNRHVVDGALALGESIFAAALGGERSGPDAHGPRPIRLPRQGSSKRV